MSKPHLSTKISVFGFVEGEVEEVFVRHLKSLYSEPRRIHVRLHLAGGKGPVYILNKAQRIRGQDSNFDHSFIFMDTDVLWPANLRNDAVAKSFELIGNTPCIESLFLTILDPTKEHSFKSSKECKRQFKRSFSNRVTTFDSNFCNKHFPKRLIERAKKKDVSLLRLIQILQGEF